MFSHDFSGFSLFFHVFQKRAICAVVRMAMFHGADGHFHCERAIMVSFMGNGDNLFPQDANFSPNREWTKAYAIWSSGQVRALCTES